MIKLCFIISFYRLKNPYVCLSFYFHLSWSDLQSILSVPSLLTLSTLSSSYFIRQSPAFQYNTIQYSTVQIR